MARHHHEFVALLVLERGSLVQEEGVPVLLRARGLVSVNEVMILSSAHLIDVPILSSCGEALLHSVLTQIELSAEPVFQISCFLLVSMNLHLQLLLTVFRIRSVVVESCLHPLGDCGGEQREVLQADQFVSAD